MCAKKFKNLLFLLFFYCSLLFNNWSIRFQKIDQGTLVTIFFSIFFTHSKSITILCLLTKFGVISMTTAHFMDDSILFKIYGNYIGFANFMVPTFTKTSIFFERMFLWPWNFTEKRQIGYTKKWKSFIDLATSVFELFKIK